MSCKAINHTHFFEGTQNYKKKGEIKIEPKTNNSGIRYYCIIFPKQYSRIACLQDSMFQHELKVFCEFNC